MAYEIRVLGVGCRRPFSIWYDAIKDAQAKKRIRTRLDRIAEGNLGDTRSIGEGVYELRIDYGPGYRLYFAIAERVLIVLLLGGDKSTQDKDTALARKLWRENKHDADTFQ